MKTYEPHTYAAKSLGSTCLGEPTKPKQSAETQQRNVRVEYEKGTDSQES